MNIVNPQTRTTQMEKPDRYSRAYVYHGIARLIWAQYCLENSIQYEGFDKAPKDFQRALLEMAESFANMALDPDMKDAALMCMASAIVDGTYLGSASITDLSRQQQHSYLTTAESALGAFLMNLWTVPPDASHRNQMSRLIDAIAPKKGVN